MRRNTHILVSLLLAIGALTAFGANYHEVQVLDEVGRKVTTITSVSIYAPNSTTDAVIYADAGLQDIITIPMTSGSTNTTLSNGFFYWYGPDGYNFSMTDGSNIANNADHRPRNGSEGTLIFPSYLTAISSTTYSDSQSATFGSGGDWVLRGGNVSNQMSFTPLADNSNFIIGVNGTSLNSDLNVFVGTDLGFEIDAGVPSLTWDGGAALFNHNSNFNVGINTGTSTGNSTIGSSTSGTVAIDTTAGVTINADDSVAITTSGAAANITADALAGSVIIDGGEAVDDAVVIRSTGTAGGIDITSLGDIDITTTGAAGEDITITNTGGSVIITATENDAGAVFIEADGGTSEKITLHSDQGTDDESILLSSDVGGITLNAAAGSVDIEAVGGTDGDINLNSGDDTTITVAGDLVFVVTGDTTLPNDMLLKTTTAISDTQMDNLAGTQIELVAAVAGNTIEFVSAIFALDWVSVAWTEPSAPDDLVIRYTDGSGAIVSQLLDATGFATATADTTAFIGPNVANAAGAAVASVAVTKAASENKALVLDNTGSEWTASGDSQVVVIVYYRLHTTAELGL